LRQPSTSGNANSASTGQSQVLLARINEKKLELENLRQLRDLSAALAGQMSVLEEKLATLADGTEGMFYKQYDTCPRNSYLLFYSSGRACAQ
jgi:DASH complex subunit DAD2